MRIATAWALLGACACSSYEPDLIEPQPVTGPRTPVTNDGGGTSSVLPDGGSAGDAMTATGDASQGPGTDGSVTEPGGPPFDPTTCSQGECWWSTGDPDGCKSAGVPRPEDRPRDEEDSRDVGAIYLGWTQIRLGSSLPDGTPNDEAWQGFGLDLDGICTNSASCNGVEGVVSCMAATPQLPFDGELCRDNTFASLQPIAARVPEIGERFGISEEVFNCELWHGSYNIIVRLTGYNGELDDAHVRVDFYNSGGVERTQGWQCPLPDYREQYPLWRPSDTFSVDQETLTGAIEEPGHLPDSKYSDPDAYVRGGYLVAQVPDGAVLRLAGDGQPYRGFPLATHESVWTGNLWKAQDGTWAMRDGLVAGRIAKEELIQSFRQVGFCPGMGLDPFYDAMVDYVQDNADVLLSGEVDPEVPCDAISLGIAFEAKQLTPGSASALEPLIECCAPGDTIEQCLAECGDGVVSGDEHCDTAIAAGEPGACPMSCAPIDVCTKAVLEGTGCAARCTPQPITAFDPNDGCCPDGADATEDADCDPICGNGVVEAPEETCDPVDSCPERCESPNACLIATLSGSAEACDASCELTPITACTAGDGCCPEGCSHLQDTDCPQTCGNGVFEPQRGETCEAGTATPCPASCNDNIGCTTDRRTGSAANCNVVCTHTPITQPRDGDSCCPDVPQANANNDDDCEPECGNGVLEAGELCDGNCPTTCEDNVACTRNVLSGAGTCNARCTFPTITEPAHGDGCCPDVASANANNDDDCEPECGNGVLEAGELCDDGNLANNDGCSATCTVEADQAACLAKLPDNNACAQCSCLDCRSQAVACYGSANAQDNARCAALIACGREHGCSSRDCYCGTVSDFSCILFNAGNGPCRAEVIAAAGSSDPFVILDRSENTNYALGRANALSVCATAECAGPCDL